jgi:hypothetical protein
MFVNGSEINEQRYRGPSKDASYQILIHLAKRFQRRRFFKNQPIRNKNCLWRTCLLMDRDEMSNLYRGPAMDVSYHVLLHLAEGFQRRRLKCENLTDDGRQAMTKAQLAKGKVS